MCMDFLIVCTGAGTTIWRRGHQPSAHRSRGSHIYYVRESPPGTPFAQPLCLPAPVRKTAPVRGTLTTFIGTLSALCAAYSTFKVTYRLGVQQSIPVPGGSNSDTSLLQHH